MHMTWPGGPRRGRLDALRADSGSPDSDRKNQARPQKSESLPRDAPDSPQATSDAGRDRDDGHF